MAQRQCTSGLATLLSVCGTPAPRHHVSQLLPRQLLNPQRRTLASYTTTPHIPRHIQRQHIRSFTSTAPNPHGDLKPPLPGQERSITFIDKDSQSHTLIVADGDNLLDIAQAHDLEMEGACGGSCACSTCHVIVTDEAVYDEMEEPSDDENDMLDLAFGLTETSRLGCQVAMSKALDGLTVKLPTMTRNLQASDFAEKEKKS